MSLMNWLKGLLAAVITAVAGAVINTMVAPETFNLEEGLNKVFTVMVFHAILGAALYLKQSPLPDNKPQELKE